LYLPRRDRKSASERRLAMFITMHAWWFGEGGLIPASAGSSATLIALVWLALLMSTVFAIVLAAPGAEPHDERLRDDDLPRGRGLPGYREFLAARDGVPDLAHHTLSRREQFHAELARDPVRSRASVDRETYLRNLR